MTFSRKGEKSQQQIILEVFDVAKSGDIVSYEALGTALGMHPDDARGNIQAAVHVAKKNLLKQQQKAVEAVTNRGYRIVAANEHVGVARKHQVKVNRALTAAKRTVDNTDFNQLSEAEKNLALAVGQALGFQQEQIRRMDIRQKRLESVVATFIPAQVEVNETQDERITALEKRLAELNQKFESET